MAGKLVLLDTSVLIDYFRKSDKLSSYLFGLVRDDYLFCISAITEFEIYTGATSSQRHYWDEFLKRTHVLPFDTHIARVAAELNQTLKRKSKQISMPDLFIAATAVDNELPLATLNRRHFQRIEELKFA